MSVSEIEKLGYYDFMAYLQVPFFNIGGNSSLENLAESLHIGPDTHILDVGCGTGGNSAYLASKYGCKVTGIDISEMMIEKAKERATEQGMGHLLDFQVGDAYNLDFPDDHFDVVITVFVSQFLDPEKAFPEFNRVLKPGGNLGINEMFRADYVPPEAVDKVDQSEEIFRDLTDLPFRLRTPSNWTTGYLNANFEDVKVEAFTDYMDTSKSLDMVDDIGGWVHLASLLWEFIILGLKSRKIRDKYREISKGKSVMLRDKDTRNYIGYVLGVGKKA